jgi:DNA-3-methyladenine glycosylase II
MLDEAALRSAMEVLAGRHEAIAAAVQRVGYPEPRQRAPGYETLLRTIVGQQVSVAAAASMWAKLEAALGQGCRPEVLLAQDYDTLRACGLSRQKQGYARSLAELVTSGALDLHALPADDEEAIAQLIQIKGIGRWSAEIYLLFAEGRPDIWPAGDLAVQAAIGTILGLTERPSEKQTRDLGEQWRPHRSAMAIMAWHHYNTKVL